MTDHCGLPVHTVTIAVDVRAAHHEAAAALASQVVEESITAPGDGADTRRPPLVAARVVELDTCRCHGGRPATQRPDSAGTPASGPANGSREALEDLGVADGSEAASRHPGLPDVATVPEPVLHALHREYLDRLALAAGEQPDRAAPTDR